MRHEPEHSCFHPCAGCAFELGSALAKKKSKEHAKYVWAVIGTDNPCDIRRYAFSHEQAIGQLAHAKRNKYKDYTGGKWTLFKLVRVDREKTAQKESNHQ